MKILYNDLSAFHCAWLWNKANIDGQLFTFNSHKVSYAETFDATMLHCLESNSQSNINIEKKFNHLTYNIKKIVTNKLWTYTNYDNQT